MKPASISLPMLFLVTALAALSAAPFVYQALYAEEAVVTESGSATIAEAGDQLAFAPPEKEKTAPAKKAPADPFAVPEGSIEELVKFIGSVQKLEPKGTSEEAALEHSRKVANAVAQAAEKLLGMEIEDEDALQVANVQMQSLWHLASIEDETAPAKIEALIEKLKADKRPGMAALAQQNILLRKIQNWKNPTPEQQADLVKEVQTLLAGGPLDQEKLQLVMMLAQMLEQLEDNKTASAIYQELIGALPKTEQSKEFVDRMQAVVRRLDLPGKFMEIKGTTLDGKPFDWDSYRGKVVLIDFWATWCGPCIRELPNVLANYEKYHDQGFEVVGISLDEDTTLVSDFVRDKHIPWATLLDKKEENRGWNNPMAVHYGISAIPAAILVDKEGKVVSLSASGENLNEHLTELLGKKE